MKVFLALVIGVLIGVAAIYFLSSDRGKSQLRSTSEKIEDATKSARDTLQDEVKVLHLRPEEIKEELNKGGQVIRRKAEQAGQAIADATADSRITAAIKAKLVADPNLSALSISVNTTAGVVTMSGSVSSAEDVSKAMVLAMQVDGVREVVSTLQVRPPSSGK